MIIGRSATIPWGRKSVFQNLGCIKKENFYLSGHNSAGSASKADSFEFVSIKNVKNICFSDY